MIGTDSLLNPEKISFEQSLEWERAAQMLDLPPQLLSHLRTPEAEFISRYHVTPHGGSDLVALYGCSYGPPAPSKIVSVTLDPSASAVSAARKAEAVQLRAALAGVDESAASLVVQVRADEMDERELWGLARDSAPEIGRYFGTGRLIAEDVPSAAFASWVVHGPAECHLSFPRLGASDYCAVRNDLIAGSAANLCSCALQSLGKNLRGARAVIVGTSLLSRAVLETLTHEGVMAVGIADESGGLLLSREDRVDDLFAHIKRGGLLAEYPGGQHARHAEVLSAAVDLLVLGSGNPEITGANASSIQARVVAEVAGPGLSPTALETLSGRELIVIPEALVGAVLPIPHLSPQSGAISGIHTALHRFQHELWDELDLIGRKFKMPLYRSILLLALQRLAAWSALTRPF